MTAPVPDASSPRRALNGVGEVSRLVLGAMTFERLGPGDGRGGAACEAVLEAAHAAGIDTIDTAPLYGFGASERIVGEWLARSGAPMRVLTKAGLVWDAPDGHGEVLFEARDEEGRPRVVRKDSRPRSILLEIERSRERLRIDRLALIQIHHRDRRVPIDETMGALSDAWRAGAVAAVGVSNFDAAHLEVAARALDRHSNGALRLSATQDLYNLLSRDVESGVLRVVRARGLGFLAFSPLAQGLLTGAMGPEREVTDWRAQTPLFSLGNRKTIAAAIDRELAPLARRHGVGVSALALAWVLSREAVTAAIVGARDTRQLEQSLGALRLVSGPRAIDPRALDRIGEAFARLELALAPSLVSRVSERLRRVARTIRSR